MSTILQSFLNRIYSQLYPEHRQLPLYHFSIPSVPRVTNVGDDVQLQLSFVAVGS